MDELLAGIRAGDHEAFSTLVRAQYGPLFDFAFSYTKDSATAEDIVQEVLLNVWQGRESLYPTGSITTYLFGAVRNRSLNHIRSRKRLVTFPTDSPESTDLRLSGVGPESADEPIQMRELLRDYSAAVAELPERRREVFQLSRLHGLTYEEIADVMDISINTVRTQISAALQHLRSRLRHYL